MKKVLIISYYWPPVTGAGVQRVFEFCRHLPQFGYDPVVLTPQDNTGSDHAAAGIPSYCAPHRLDPVALWKRRQAGTRSVTGDSSSRLLEFIRLNMFIPDAKIGWRRTARRKALEIMRIEKPSLVFTTAPPYTVHLVGMDLKKSFTIPWVADFRDPWLECHAYNRVYRTFLAVSLNRRMERNVLQCADHVTCAIHSQKQLLQNKVSAAKRENITTIHNGYDATVWDGVTSLQPTSRFCLSHFGTVYADGFNGRFFKELARMVREHPQLKQDFTLRMTGVIPSPVHDLLHASFSQENLAISPPVPPEQIQCMLGEQQMLLLLVNAGGLHAYSHPSKVFEYMASGNTILAVGPKNHEVMNILEKNAGNRSCLAEHPEEYLQAVLGTYQAWRDKKLPSLPILSRDFDRKHLTGRLASVFDQVLTGQTGRCSRDSPQNESEHRT